jgi:hypothetical protein
LKIDDKSSIHQLPFAAGFNPARGKESRDYMASNKQTVKLYWVTTADHAEDWFVALDGAFDLVYGCVEAALVYLED